MMHLIGLGVGVAALMTVLAIGSIYKPVVTTASQAVAIAIQRAVFRLGKLIRQVRIWSVIATFTARLGRSC
jgi:hypothetical protein